MSDRVKTFNVEDTNLVSSAKSKTKKVKESVAQAEAEKFGIVEINNSSSKSKVKKTAERGFERNNVSCSKKPIKSKLHKVDDYFDFNLRANSKSEEANGKASALKMKTEDVEVIKEKTASSKSVQSKVANTERHQAIIAEVADRVVFDEEANRNIAVARIGALFDCEKRMINC